MLSALQHAQMRLNYTFTEQDFLKGKVGRMMVADDFRFEENISQPLLMYFVYPTLCQSQISLDQHAMPKESPRERTG